MPDTPLNLDALEAVAHERYEARRSFEGLPPWEDLLERNRKAEIRGLGNIVSAYLAAAQSVVNSDTELHVGTLIEDKTGQQLWNVWRTGGPAVHWMDDEGRPATPVFPARVLYRPEVDK